MASRGLCSLGTRRFSIDLAALPADLHRQLLAICRAQDKPAARVLREIMWSYARRRKDPSDAEPSPDASWRDRPSCQVLYDYIPNLRSNPLLQAREVLRLLAEEGIEGSGKEAEPRGDGD